MKKNLTVFFFRFLGYTLILVMLYLLVKDMIPAKFYYGHTLYLFIFFFIINLVFHYGLLYNFAKSNRSFVMYYMITTFLKLFLFLAILIIYAVFHHGKAIAFICNFMVIYILYSIFEVTSVFRYFSNKPVQEPQIISGE